MSLAGRLAALPKFLEDSWRRRKVDDHRLTTVPDFHTGARPWEQAGSCTPKGLLIAMVKLIARELHRDHIGSLLKDRLLDF